MMQEDKTGVFTLWKQWTWVHGFTQSSLSIYGDDHVIDNKSTHNCHALMITLWWLHVLKHIVERSTHMCYWCHPRKASAWLLSLHHVILLPFYPQIKDVWLHRYCHSTHMPLSLGHPSSTYITLLYIKTLYNTSAMIYKLCFRISPIYLHLALSNTS